jgi:phage terminase Nu1 subunit (DNA packaging protein)
MPRAEKPIDRVVTLKRLSELLGRDRNTVMKWTAEPDFPSVSRPGTKGGEWQLDLSDVVRWLERRAAAEAADASASLDGDVSLDQMKKRKLYQEIIRSTAENAEYLNQLARWTTVTEQVAKEYGEVRSRLMLFPNRFATRCPEELRSLAKKLADEAVRSALDSLKLDANTAGSPE